jgi:hypothetical protein
VPLICILGIPCCNQRFLKIMKFEVSKLYILEIPVVNFFVLEKLETKWKMKHL